MDKNIIDKDAIARQYAKNIGYDSIRPAGIKDGWSYYHTFNKVNLGRKTGLSHIIKIDSNGQIAKVEVLKELM